ncbi:MAG: thiamine pyrophosphate-binding protein, partial [Phaeodactylibacter sp.]|nr:thiamine pyrophosphate-binding protein [Phaeodactylibacter sp.]
VCFSIAGPGATNMFTGLWDAKVDRAPILALTGQVATQVVGTGNFQEVDLVRAFQTVAEFNHRVQRDSQYAELMALAIKHALLKRDVSHLTFPDEIQTLPVAKPSSDRQEPANRLAAQQIAPPKVEFDKAVSLLQEAKQPLIVMGHGARFHRKVVIELAEQLDCAVVTTFKGKGLIPDSHPLAGGVLGRSGTPIASWLMNECDLILVFGASFSKHTGITDKKPTIQVDFDPLALAKFHKIDCQLWGEISVTVQMLKEALNSKENGPDQKLLIADRKAIWLKEKARRLLEEREEGVSSIAVFDALNRFAPENAVMCVDVGNNAYSFGRYYESKAQNDFLMSGYLGSIGFALPAAMGAWAAVGSSRPVIAVAGDGGFGQYMAELSTAVQYEMPIKIIILNNNELGKISKEQRAGEFDVWKTRLHNPSFAAFAQSCGALGLHVNQSGKALDDALQQILSHNGPALLEVMTDAGLI